MGEERNNQKQLTDIDKLIIVLDNLKTLYSIDIDNYYYDLLEQAIEYGMTPEQFWEDDIEVFYCYQNAYLKKIHRISHLQGLYTNMAINISLANVLKKKSSNNIEYPKEDMFTQSINKVINEINDNNNNDNNKIKSKVTKDNLEEQYRLRLSKCY